MRPLGLTPGLRPLALTTAGRVLIGDEDGFVRFYRPETMAAQRKTRCRESLAQMKRRAWESCNDFFFVKYSLAIRTYRQCSSSKLRFTPATELALMLPAKLCVFWR